MSVPLMATACMAKMYWLWSKHIQANVHRLSQKTKSMSRVLPENLLTNFLLFIRPVIPLQCSYKPTAGPYLEPDASSSYLTFYTFVFSSILRNMFLFSCITIELDRSVF
jgi:hypothetical protein